MKIIFDTSIIVEIDRQNEKVINLLKSLVKKNVDLVISTVTVSEILTGSYLTKNVNNSVQIAKEVLSQFSWINFEGEIAEKTAQLTAYLISEKKMVEYPDIIISASFINSHSDYLLTLNKKDFVLFPHLNGKVFSPEEFEKLFVKTFK